MSAGFLEREVFLCVAENAPLVSIDLIITRMGGKEVLLGKRRNPPAEGWWFVPGGRIRKGESHAEAFRRITASEVGKELPFEQAKMLGSWAHLYPEEAFRGQKAKGIHYVTLGYQIEYNVPPTALPKEQHENFRWFTLKEALTSPKVHKYTRLYLEALQASYERQK